MNQKKAGVLFSYLSMGARIVIGLVFTPFLLSRIGDGQYGIYSLSQSLISFIALLDLGFSQTLVRYIAKSKALNNTDEESYLNGFFLQLFSAIACFALLIGIGIIFIYPLVCSKTLSTEEIQLFRIVFSILLVDTIISFPGCVFSATLNAYERFFFQKALDFTMVIVKYISMTLLLLFGYKVVAITIITAGSSIIIKLLNALYCKKRLNIRFHFGNYRKDLIKEIFLFSFFIFLNLIIDFLYNSTDKLILGAVKGTFAVTVYSFGVFFHTYFQELSTAMSGVFMPKVVYLYEHDRDIEGLSDLFLMIGRLQMAVLFLALSGFVAYGQEFLILWVGKEYIDAYYIGLLIMLPAIVPLSQNIGISILRAMNLHKYRSYMYLGIAILNVFISIPLARKYAGIGVAIGTCIACFAGQITFMNIYYSRKIGINIKEYWKSFIRFLIPIGILAGIAILVKQAIAITGWTMLVVHIAVYSIIYCIVYWVFLSNEFEKHLITDTIRRIGVRRK